MLATTMGITFDPAKAWDERKQLFKSSGLIIRTSNVAQSAEGGFTASPRARKTASGISSPRQRRRPPRVLG
jgi:hypothetical protein